MRGEAVSLEFADITAAIEKRLFVGKVPHGTAEEELRSAFEPFGELTECRVVPDRSGGGSNGIGFVGFGSWGAAHRALMETDGRKKLRGHEGQPSALVVSFAERTSVVGRGGGLAYAKGLDANRVFVGSLPEDTMEGELTDRFQLCGKVEGCHLLPPKSSSRSRLRCAFVNFQTWGEALDAVENLNGQQLRESGEPMSVMLAQPKEGTMPSAPRRGHHEQHHHRFRAGSEPDDGPFQSPAMVVAMPDAKKRRIESGTLELTVLLAAYVAAVNGDGPRDACEILHGQLMTARDQLLAARDSGGPSLAVLPGQLALCGSASPVGSSGLAPTSADRDSARLFVGGLSHDCSDDDLSSLAGQLNFSARSSQLLECRVLPGKGCGYLRYSSWEAAEEAYAALQGREVEGWAQVLRVQWATPKPGSEHGGGGGAYSGGGGYQGGGGRAVSPPPWSPRSERERERDAPAAYQETPDRSYSEAEVEAQGLEPTRLFVGQIARDAVDAGATLRPIFESFGQLQEFRWVQDKGVLYASYTCFREAQAAVQALSRRPVPGVSKSLNVRFSERRGY